MKFIGGETGTYSQSFAAYFLNPRNHRPRTPLNFFSFHNYPISGNVPAQWQANYFTGTGAYGLTANQLATSLTQLNHIRNTESPHTKIFLDELGTFNAAGGAPTTGAAPYSAFNPLYWVASGANFAANFITAERLGVASISMTQMLGYPTQSEAVTMTDWNTGKPNAHYWTLKLINENFGPGDKLVRTTTSSANIDAQAAKTPTGRKVLLVNTSDQTVPTRLPAGIDPSTARVTAVDQTSGEHPPIRLTISHGSFKLPPFATAVISEVKAPAKLSAIVHRSARVIPQGKIGNGSSR